MSKDITDEQRREVARRLRDFGEDGSPAEFIYGGTECYDQMLVRVLRQIVGKGDLFETLADLIDRPTCRAVEFERARWTGGDGEVRRIVEHRCSACGKEPWGDADSITRFCPHCGAEVAR